MADRSTGDCLGPIVGTNLKKLGYTVVGTLEEPLHAQNLTSQIEYIKKQYPSELIIAIDSGLGKTESVGNILLFNGPLRPGAAVQKALPVIGDISIMGIVNVGGFLETQVLQCTRLHTVMSLAQKITFQIWQAIPSPKANRFQLT